MTIRLFTSEPVKLSTASPRARDYSLPGEVCDCVGGITIVRTERSRSPEYALDRAALGEVLLQARGGGGKGQTADIQLGRHGAPPGPGRRRGSPDSSACQTRPVDADDPTEAKPRGNCRAQQPNAPDRTLKPCPYASPV